LAKNEGQADIERGTKQLTDTAAEKRRISSRRILQETAAVVVFVWPVGAMMIRKTQQAAMTTSSGNTIADLGL
jgi:hypothetical protein